MFGFITISQRGATLRYYKVGPHFCIQSRTSGIAKSGKYYKKGQYNLLDGRQLFPENFGEAELLSVTVIKKKIYPYHRNIYFIC